MEINFNFNGLEIKYQSNDMKENFNYIIHKCRSEIDLNSITFLYNGNYIDGNLPISKIINNNDIERKKMNIIIINKKELNQNFINSKDTICPKCGESAKLDITEYKLLIQCIKEHNLGNILLNEY